MASQHFGPLFLAGVDPRVIDREVNGQFMARQDEARDVLQRHVRERFSEQLTDILRT